jgi:hypothetical protein
MTAFFIITATKTSKLTCAFFSFLSAMVAYNVNAEKQWNCQQTPGKFILVCDMKLRSS